MTEARGRDVHPASEEAGRTAADRTAADRPIVFLAGVHRSGTSLLHELLRQHSDVGGFVHTGVPQDEGQHLQTVFPPARAYGGMGRFAFSDEAWLTEQSSLATEDNREKLWREWSRYWDLDARILIEKSPPNLVRARYLQWAFPNASFVVIVRHPIAVALATFKRHRLNVWKGRTVSSLVRHWLVAHERFADDLQHLRRVRVLAYEDMIAAPDAVLRQLWQFMGLPPEQVDTRKVNAARNDTHLTHWRRLQTGPVTRWYARALVHEFEERVNRFGYSLTDVSARGASMLGGSVDP